MSQAALAAVKGDAAVCRQTVALVLGYRQKQCDSDTVWIYYLYSMYPAAAVLLSISQEPYGKSEINLLRKNESKMLIALQSQRQREYRAGD